MDRMTNFAHRGLARVWKSVFQPAERYPADPRAVFILALSVFGGLTAMLLQAAPESLESLLPRWGVMTWGILLTVGSGMAMIGMMFRGINGIITEQIGNVCVAVTTVFYSILALMVLGDDAVQSIGIILAWGLACGLRYIQLQALINRAYRKKIRDEVAEQFRDDVKEGFNANDGEAPA